jgi:autotransporter-associated beta strand protein
MILVCGFVAAILLLPPPAARAQTTAWNVQSGDWSVGSYWTAGLPTSNTGAYVDNGGTATVSSTAPVCGSLYLGTAAGSGTLEITGGGLVNYGLGYVGYQGTGSVLQSGGINSVAVDTGVGMTLGAYPGSSGTYNLSAGNLSTLYADIVVGDGGTGDFVQSGGAVSIAEDLIVGSGRGGSGTYSLGGTGQLRAPYEVVGYQGAGAFTQSGGTNSANNLSLGDHAGGTGTYNLNGGTLIVQSLAGGSGAAAFNFNGGTLQAVATFSTALPISLTGSGGDSTIDTAGKTLTLAGPLSGPGGLIKADSGTLSLTGTNTYSGGTTISGGTLAPASASALAGHNSPSSVFVQGGAALSISTGSSGWTTGDIADLLAANGPNFAPGSVLGIDTTNAGITYAAPIVGNMGLAKAGGNTLALTGTSAYSGGTTVSAGTLQLGDGAANNGYVQGNILDNAAVAFANPVAQAYSNVISGSGALTKSGTGMLTLTGSNTYSGGTTVSAGTLQLGDGTANNGYVQGNILDNAAVAFANPTAQTYSNVISGNGSLTKSGSGTLALTGSNTYTGGTTINGGVLQLGDGVSRNGYVAGIIADNAALNFANPSAQAFAGTISGAGSLTKSGAGTLTLSGSNTFTGGTTVGGGTLTLGNTAALLGSTLDTSGAGVLSFGSLTAATLGGLQGSGGLVLQNTAGAGVSVKVGNNNASTTFNGSLSGSGSLVKVGSGTLTLAASNTYSGTTTVSGGVLAAGAAGALSPYSGMTVSGGTLASLTSANTVKSLTVTSGGMLELGLGDLLTSTGVATLGGTLDLSGTAGPGPVELLAYSSKTGTFATVSGLPAGYTLQYTPTELLAVPEPSTLALLAAGLACGAAVWPRRKSG